MNTLVYSDTTPEQTSSAASIASTMQQMSISFGVALASLATAVFIPDRFSSDAHAMIGGVHKAFFALGAMTLISTLIFRELKSSDGDNASQHKELVHADQSCGNKCFCTLPSALRGRLSSTTNLRGILNEASEARHRSSIVTASNPACTTT